MQTAFIEFFTLALAHFFALICPGPDFILIIANATRHGFSRTAWTCLGIACANGIYILAAISGFSLVRENAALFTVMKLLAAGYLCYLGFLLLRSARKPQETVSPRTAPATSRITLFRRGFLAAILNPKNAIFYLSLMSLIVSEQTPVMRQLGYGLWMFSAVLGWDLLIAWGSGNTRSQKTLSRHGWKLERLCGCVLILVGSLVALQ
jgi:threonine/homoserine/homoserine lactone efflux protein